MRPEALPWWRQALVNRRDYAWEQKQRCATLGEWWHGAAIYQLMTWSYLDTNGDGRGDLRGIIHSLDYLGSLGIDAIWLTPIYPSGDIDLGYDVKDMCAVDHAFGTLDDFDRLLRLAHQRGLRVMLDMVWNHTSDQHPWFRESRSGRENARADWYVWADPAEDGGPPNNWPSVFTGGSGWHYAPERGQYYFANFFPNQPDLNWHNPDVRAAILEVARFWLDRGIDGMRLDAVNFYAHDPQLRDNPVREDTQEFPDGFHLDNPAAKQQLVNSFNREETLEYLQPIRELADTYPGVALLGEVVMTDDSIGTAARYTRGGDLLHLAYHSGLLFDERMTAERMRRVVGRTLDTFGTCGCCWMAGNHDYGRMSSRWGGDRFPYPHGFRRTVAAMLMALPGALCIWQGDELGLPDARIPEDIPYDRLRDPFAEAHGSGRDGSRTPMPWNDHTAHSGFTHAEQPWLPIPRSHRILNVEQQQLDPDSLLNDWRSLLRWRAAQPAMRAGRTELLEAEAPWLALRRNYADQALLCLFNLGDEAQTIDLSDHAHLRIVEGLGFDVDALGKGRFRVPAWGTLIADISRDYGATHAELHPPGFEAHRHADDRDGSGDQG